MQRMAQALATLGIRTDEVEISLQSLFHHRHPDVTETRVAIRISGDARSNHQLNSSLYRSENIVYLYRIGVTENLSAPQAIGRFTPTENGGTDVVRHDSVLSLRTLHPRLRAWLRHPR